jgi:hypothetical protein
MGWWKVRDTNDLVGDDAFGVMRAAAKEVVSLYEQQHGRRPTRTEWQQLVFDALQPRDGGAAMFSEDVRPASVDLHVESFDPREYDLD